MKLVQKLTLALILGISAVLAANGYSRVRREVDVEVVGAEGRQRVVRSAVGQGSEFAVYLPVGGAG